MPLLPPLLLNLLSRGFPRRWLPPSRRSQAFPDPLRLPRVLQLLESPIYVPPAILLESSEVLRPSCISNATKKKSPDTLKQVW